MHAEGWPISFDLRCAWVCLWGPILRLTRCLGWSTMGWSQERFACRTERGLATAPGPRALGRVHRGPAPALALGALGHPDPAASPAAAPSTAPTTAPTSTCPCLCPCPLHNLPLSPLPVPLPLPLPLHRHGHGGREGGREGERAAANPCPVTHAGVMGALHQQPS